MEILRRDRFAAIVESRIAALAPSILERISNLLAFRCAPPRYSRRQNVLNGQGTFENGGRYLLPRVAPAVSVALEEETARQENMASRRAAGILGEPRSHSSIVMRLKLDYVLNLKSDHLIAALGLAPRLLIELNWERENAQGFEAVTQVIGRAALRLPMLQAIMHPSAACPGGTCLLLFPERIPSDQIELIHEEDLVH